jgi:hypothetical protein
VSFTNEEKVQSFNQASPFTAVIHISVGVIGGYVCYMYSSYEVKDISTSWLVLMKA